MSQQPKFRRRNAVGLPKLPTKMPYPDPPADPDGPANGLSAQVRKPFELAMQKTAERMKKQAEQAPPDPPPAG